MRILITGGASDLAGRIAAGLVAQHDVRLVDRVAAPSEYEFAVSPLSHDTSTRLLLQDRDALILLYTQPLEGDTEHTVIDVATRRVYNLLLAAVDAKVRRVICISTLALMEAYEPDLTVSERWRPRPTTDPESLAAYLTEAVCREFGREHKLDVTVLRIGNVIDDDEMLTATTHSYLRHADLVEGVQRALDMPPRPWAVYHLQSDAEDPRFTTAKARQELGYVGRTASAI